MFSREELEEMSPQTKKGLYEEIIHEENSQDSSMN